MTYWIELQCDAVMPGGAGPARANADDCYSFVNGNPSMLTDDPRGTLPILHSEARGKGWHRARQGGWSCPGCVRAGRSPETN